VSISVAREAIKRKACETSRTSELNVLLECVLFDEYFSMACLLGTPHGRVLIILIGSIALVGGRNMFLLWII